jgi:L-asparaginase II
MLDTAPDTAGRNEPPVLVEVHRGDMVESRHRVSIEVSNVKGEMLVALGDIFTDVYPRSAIKPLQALAMMESGAVEKFGLTNKEISLSCASHNAEPDHIATVRTWLEKIGCTAADFECGSHFPFREQQLVEFVKAGITPERIHNNCSGKHTGFLSAAKALGYDTKGYIKFGHPVQQSILGIMEQMTGLDLISSPRGIDGCGIPTIAVLLGNLALAFARMADPSDQPERREEACARIMTAMAEEPFMVAGTGRFCTDVMKVVGGRAIMKVGAEGVYCATLIEQGLGVAIKAEDGHMRAAEVALGRVLQYFGITTTEEAQLLSQSFVPKIYNAEGDVTGHINFVENGPLKI